MSLDRVAPAAMLFRGRELVNMYMPDKASIDRPVKDANSFGAPGTGYTQVVASVDCRVNSRRSGLGDGEPDMMESTDVDLQEVIILMPNGTDVRQGDRLTVSDLHYYVQGVTPPNVVSLFKRAICTRTRDG